MRAAASCLAFLTSVGVSPSCFCLEWLGVEPSHLTFPCGAAEGHAFGLFVLWCFTGEPWLTLKSCLSGSAVPSWSSAEEGRFLLRCLYLSTPLCCWPLHFEVWAIEAKKKSQGAPHCVVPRVPGQSAFFSPPFSSMSCPELLVLFCRRNKEMMAASSLCIRIMLHILI